MAKSRLRHRRKKYFQDAKREWLFNNGKPNIFLILFGIFVTVAGIIGIVGAILKYIKIVSK